MTPPVVIVIHPRERLTKCSAAPLGKRPDCLLRTFRVDPLPDLADYIRLDRDGPELSMGDARLGLLVLDGTWRLAETMRCDFASVPARRIVGWRTAYPRRSKMHADPVDGLATVEAIVAAYTILGRNTSRLLEDYRWSTAFVERNRHHFCRPAATCSSA